MKWRWRIIIGLMLIAFASNHLEYHYRAQRIREQAQATDAPVVQVVNNAAGHNSIQIDEQSVSSGYLYFNTLEAWDFNREAPTPCPQSVIDVNDQMVKLMGFMYPLQEGEEITVFCLLRSTQTCCYGPRPQYNQYVFVEMSQPVKFERLAPVVVEGRFIIDPKPNDGYIYRIEGQSVRSAVPGDEPVNAVEFAEENTLPIFDFAPLEAVKTAPDKDSEIAQLRADLSGRQMVVSGFIVGKTEDVPPKMMIGKYAWDGVSKGVPPGLYNTVLVAPKTSEDIPPVWWQEAVFKGTINVTQDPSQRRSNGVVSLQDATLAIVRGSGQGVLTDSGPLLPPGYELIVLIGLGVVLLFDRLSKGNRSVATAGKEK